MTLLDGGITADPTNPPATTDPTGTTTTTPEVISLNLPNENSKPEEWNEFYSKLGRPENPDGYEFKRSENIPEGLYKEETSKEFAKFMHEQGLTKKQAQNIFNKYNEMMLGEHNSFTENSKKLAEENVAAIKKEWGMAFDQNVAKAKEAFSAFGSPELKQIMEDTGLGNHPAVLKFFHNVATKIGEDATKGGGGGLTSFAKTPEQAKTDIAKLNADPKFIEAYHSSSNPGHKEAVAKMQALFKEAYPPVE